MSGLETNAPGILFANDPRIQQVIKAKQSASGEKKPPSESINFKDLPPEGQAQMAEQAGIKLHPEALAAYNENKAKEEVAKDITAEAGKRSIPIPMTEEVE